MLSRIGVLALSATILVTSCGPTGDVDLVSRFFMLLSAKDYNAAADLVRTRDGSRISGQVRDQNMSGWRRSYDKYDVHFTRVLVRRITRLTDSELAALNADEGYVEDVHFEGTSNSPCVPVNNDVIPGTSQPIAVRSRAIGWFITVDSMVGFISTCPGG